MKIKVDKNINFKGWVWDSNLSGKITEAFNGVWQQVEEAIAKEMAETVRNQFREDGIEVELVNWGDEKSDDGVRATIWVSSFTVGTESDPLLVDVTVANLLDELIASSPRDARELIPDFRAMLARLEAIPNE